MAGLPDIALLVEPSMAFTRGLIQGVSAYAQAKGHWRLHLLEQLYPGPLKRLLGGRSYDGFIARVKTPAIAAVLSETGRPVVNVWGTSIAPQWPRVEADPAAIVTLAAEHLLHRGYQHFAFCGMPRYEWSNTRRACFVEEFQSKGLACAWLDLPSLSVEIELPLKEQESLCRWIAKLPKPVGVMACQDQCGRAVLEACALAGAAVPDEVGVIGVDNDTLVCELCMPPLSSVALNADRTGYVAAETLALMLRGQRPEDDEIRIKPTTLVGRASTDAGISGEPIISEALRFIRAYACQGISSLEVAQHMNVSRRFMEQKFRKILGRTIYTEIQRVRMEAAQRLLGETNWKIRVIAERCGFKTAPRMSEVFYEKLQLRPGEYRRRIQQ